MTSPRHSAGAPADDDRLPPFAEQMAEQLGGWRGMVESSVPVLVFVVVNIITSLRPALIASVGVAVAIAVLRLLQRKPVRHAINGLFGIAIGAFIAWRTGEARDFYLPGIIQGYAFAAALLISAAVRQPIVGWVWSVIMAGGKSDWRKDPLMLRTFTWLTVRVGAGVDRQGGRAGVALPRQAGRPARHRPARARHAPVRAADRPDRLGGPPGDQKPPAGRPRGLS